MDVWLVDGIKNNKVGGGFHNNVLGCAQDTIFGNNFHDNIVGITYENIFGHDNKYNSIGGASQTIFGGQFETNFIDIVGQCEFGYGCWNNAIDTGFFENKISIFQGNTIGFNFKGNTALTFLKVLKLIISETILIPIYAWINFLEM